jgi:biopolymer transport protein TolR
MGMTVGKKGVRSDLNITPMIDILLVLLIIFMVMTPLMMMQHRVEVPKRAEVDMPQDVTQDQVVITFTHEGHLFLNQTRIDKADLGKELGERFKDRRDKTVFLNIDPEANYGESMRIIDVAHNSGIDKLAVVTQKPGESFQVPGQGK